MRRKEGVTIIMANTLTLNEKLEIKKNAQYILTAMSDIGKNGDAYCTDERLLRVCKGAKPKLTVAQYRTDKVLLMQAGYLHQEGQHLYAQRTWEYEVAASECLAGIFVAPPLSLISIPDELCAGGVRLSAQQREAVILALNSRLSVILGGAGSGKTTLIEALVKCCYESDALSGQTVVAAPTGKAARNLKERTGLEARTVHSALGKAPDDDFLDPVVWGYTDLVVIDEASMMSLEMLAGILSHVQSECRVVLLGDPQQLLSVGAGNVLPDLLTLGVPSIRLEQQYRQSEDAAALRHNVVHFPQLYMARELRWDDSFRLLPTNDSDIAGIVCKEATQRYAAGESVQVLSPTNTKTDFSVTALNTRLQNMLNPPLKGKPTWEGFRDGDRVIVTKNNSYYHVCNGDVGTLHIRGQEPNRSAVLELNGQRVCWPIDYVEGFDGLEDMVPPEISLAYALTVHKSQGSQYDTIILPVSTATAKMLYRNLLYTAISRARREVILIGSQEAVNIAMQCVPVPRKTKLVSRTNMLRYKRSA